MTLSLKMFIFCENNQLGIYYQSFGSGSTSTSVYKKEKVSSMAIDFTGILDTLIKARMFKLKSVRDTG